MKLFIHYKWQKTKTGNIQLLYMCIVALFFSFLDYHVMMNKVVYYITNSYLRHNNKRHMCMCCGC